MSANQLSMSCLREFAPSNSPLFAYRIESTGSPMHDWAQHIAANNLFRRDLEETSLLGGNVVVRAVEGDEKPALERVKILSLTYATRVFGNVEDAKEFVRCVRSIADPQATQFELEQIAGFYYRECRQRKTPEVLKEMAFLGMEMTLVTAEANELEIEHSETEIREIELTAADKKRVRQAQKHLPLLPAPTPNFDAEMKSVEKRLSRTLITKATRDEFAAYYLSDAGKTLGELDEDFRKFDAHEQYTEDGLFGLNMSGTTHTEVVLELNAEVTAEYLPETIQPLAKTLGLIFVGYEIGGRTAQVARHFIACRKIEDLDNIRAREAFRLNFPFVETTKPQLTEFSLLPLKRAEISEWIDLQLDLVYSREVVRLGRRVGIGKDGSWQEFTVNQTVNPEFDEKQYASQILHILLEQMERDFHLSSLRRNEVYQSVYLKIRGAQDTAILAQTAENARRAKEEKRLNLKEYTTLSTVAKSQFGKLNNARPSATFYRLEKEIRHADTRKISYLKWAMYGSNLPTHPIHKLPKQEVQRAWTALRSRDLILKQKAAESNRFLQPQLQFNQTYPNSQVKVTPIVH
ncbi:MAG TPA: hypothetical protein PKY82_08125 [Pyrinomonadaceae bacterium]|nr:hypothetical protein [Pyrinomonadaceae bacterium]